MRSLVSIEQQSPRRPCNISSNMNSGGSKGGARDAPQGSKFFHLHAVFGKIVCWRPLDSWRRHLGEILDPSLMKTKIKNNYNYHIYLINSLNMSLKNVILNILLNLISRNLILFENNTQIWDWKSGECGCTLIQIWPMILIHLQISADHICRNLDLYFLVFFRRRGYPNFRWPRKIPAMGGCCLIVTPSQT